MSSVEDEIKRTGRRIEKEVKRPFEQVGDVVQEGLDIVRGKDAQEAAERAAKIQEKVGQRAITVSEEAQLRLEEALAPFIQALGTDLIPQVQSLYGANVGESISQDPALQALLDESQRRITGMQSAQGRPLGETDMLLQDAFLRTGSDLLSRQRGDLLSALQFGQSSAAQQGVSGINTGRDIGSYLTQIANAQGGAQIAGAQARSAGLNNLLNLGGQIAGMFFGKPPGV